jgi:DNA (cytosine-5)-methyltransferase 1
MTSVGPLPRLLELFGCEGGASVGYARWFRVYVVDLDKNRLRRNPFSKHHGDALEVMRRLIAGERLAFISPDGETEWLGLEDFAAVHASPPCQGYTRGNAGKETSWPKLIPDVRALLIEAGKPYVIENVTDAAPEMVNPVALCGCMFDLSTTDTDGIQIHLKRERMFETGGFTLTPPRPCDHDGIEWWAGAYGGARRDKYEAKYVRKGGYVPPDIEVVKALLGIEHDMTWKGLFECIPPAYADWVGSQLVRAL